MQGRLVGRHILGGRQRDAPHYGQKRLFLHHRRAQSPFRQCVHHHSRRPGRERQAPGLLRAAGHTVHRLRLPVRGHRFRQVRLQDLSQGLGDLSGRRCHAAQGRHIRRGRDNGGARSAGLRQAVGRRLQLRSHQGQKDGRPGGGHRGGLQGERHSYHRESHNRQGDRLRSLRRCRRCPRPTAHRDSTRTRARVL